jgi:hypothetical protein
MSHKPKQLFASHTKLDEDFCNRLDVVASRVGIKVFRSEFETLENPPWKSIKEAMLKSSALFLLVGKELTKAQSASEINPENKEKWKFTQNWIAYEIGLACQQGLDVWVVCDSISINFPVPYLNNYEVWGIDPKGKIQLEGYKTFLASYCEGMHYPIGMIYKNSKNEEIGITVKCPSCGAVFNLHSVLPKGMELPCPTCLRTLKFEAGWLLNL